jgi:hypothetical protein
LQDDPAQSLEAYNILGRHDWGPVSDHDGWCFLCEYRDLRAEGEEENPVAREMYRLFDNVNGLGLFKLCRVIQHKYEEDFRDAEPENRPWTLRSINTHILEHGALSEKAQYKVLSNATFHMMSVLLKTGVAGQHRETGEVYVNQKGVAQLGKLGKEYRIYQDLYNKA